MLPTGWVPVGPACGLRGQVGYDSYDEAIVGGRCTAIAFDVKSPASTESEIIYIGTSNGGVWGSTDSGLTWRAMTDERISLAIGGLAVDPTTHKLYVAPGESKDGNVYAGNGLLVYDPSTDAWTFRQHNNLNWIWSSAMVVEHRQVVPFDRLLYLGGEKDTGLQRSTDDGVSWLRITVEDITPEARVSGIAYVPRDKPENAVMYVALYRRGLWKRKGHDDPFTNMNIPISAATKRIVVAACESNPDHVLVACANDKSGLSGIYTSSNGGAQWVPGPVLDPAPKQTNYNLAVAIHPANPDIMFFAEARLWRSEDHGKSWKIVSNPTGDMPGIHADNHVIRYDPKDPTQWWAGNDGGVWLSTDTGKTWKPRNRGLQNFLFYSFAHDPEVESAALAGAQDNGTLRYEGTPAWRLVAKGDGFFVAIDPQNKKNWFASYCFLHDGKILAFKGSGEYGARDSFGVRVKGIVNRFPKDQEPFYVPFVLDPKVPSTAYLGTNNLWVTIDSGDSGWNPVNLDNGDGTTTVFDTSLPVAGVTTASSATAITSICVHPEDSTIVYVGTADGRFFRLTKNANNTWSKNQAGFTPSPNQCIADIAVPPTKQAGTSSKTVYAAIGSKPATFVTPTTAAGGRFFYSEDYGNTFVPRKDAHLDITIDGVALPHTDNAVNAVCVDPTHADDVYIGTDHGVFYSGDRGLTWSDFGDNLPRTAIYDLQYHPGTKLLRAATFGRGVWERPLDPALPHASPVGVDLYLRDNPLDAGRRKPSTEGTGPLDTEPATWSGGADIKVDTETWFSGYQKLASTVDYTDNGDADFIAFSLLEHEKIHHNYVSHIYAQVHNRGPLDTSNVNLRAWFAMKVNQGYPNLPPDFWTAFVADSDSTDVSKWIPLHNQTIQQIRAGEPAVVRFDHTFPDMNCVGILVAVTNPDDPIGDPATLPLVVKDAVQQNKRVTLKEVDIGLTTGEIVFVVLLTVGLAGGAALAIGLGVANS